MAAASALADAEGLAERLAEGLADALAVASSLESPSELSDFALESASLASSSFESSAGLIWMPMALNASSCAGVNRSASTLTSTVPWTMLCPRKPTVENSLLSVASTFGS